MASSIEHEKAQEGDGESRQRLDSRDLKAAEEALLPSYQTPFSCYDENERRSLHLRHQSNLLELFFDLFLAANLATFTESHSIVDRGSLVAYVGFFLIIWSTWFQITLHDVRFAQDSVYERTCKILQFMVFVAFALVGANFSPPKEDSELLLTDLPKEATEVGMQQMNFWLLSVTLCFSRGLLAVQYLILYLSKRRPARLKVPLLLNVLVFFVSGSIFVGLADVFSAKAEAHTGVAMAYATWYLVLLFELIAIIQISTVWKEINFEQTHLTERMGLLTFIVIGEGAIGASKTIVEIMGGRALGLEPIFLVTCILLILVFLWAVYFDNLPTTLHGSTWQQVWACMHLPLHLSFVGILEGSRQVAMMRYIRESLNSLAAEANELCLRQHLDGEKLGAKLIHYIMEYDFGSLHPTAGEYFRMKEDIAIIQGVPGICSAANTTAIKNIFVTGPTMFPGFKDLLFHFAKALFVSDGAEDISPSKKGRDGFALLDRSVITVYLYYWSSVLAMLLTLTILYRLNRPKGNDAGDLISILARAFMAILAIVLIALYGNTVAWMDFIASRAMLPTLCGILAFVISADRLGRRIRVRKVKTYLESRPQGQDLDAHDKDALQEEDRRAAERERNEVEQDRDTNSAWIVSNESVNRSRATRRQGGVFVPTRTSMYNYLMHQPTTRSNGP